jgi:hypothetical protein
MDADLRGIQWRNVATPKVLAATVAAMASAHRRLRRARSFFRQAAIAASSTY